MLDNLGSTYPLPATQNLFSLWWLCNSVENHVTVHEFAQSFVVFNLQKKAAFSRLFCRGFHRKNWDGQSQHGHSNLRVRINVTKHLRDCLHTFIQLSLPAACWRCCCSLHFTGQLRYWEGEWLAQSHSGRGSQNSGVAGPASGYMHSGAVLLCHKAHFSVYPQDTLKLSYSVFTWVNWDTDAEAEWPTALHWGVVTSSQSQATASLLLPSRVPLR